MANRYVYSGASGAGTGADWTNAHTTLAAAITAGAAGDVYYIAHDHAENPGSALTFSVKGTAASPDRFICVNRAGSVPPVSSDLRTTASFTTTGNNAITIGSGGTPHAYFYGLIFGAGSGAVNAVLTFGMTYGRFEACTFQKNGTTGTGQAIQNSGGGLDWINCTVQFGAITDSMRPGALLRWSNTASAIQGATLPTTLIGSASTGLIVLDGLDLSALGSGKTLAAVAASAAIVSLINCKLGASVTVATTPTTANGRVDSLISDSSSNQARQERYTYQGTLTTETTIIPSSQQASDGTTPIAWKAATTANAKWQSPFETFPYAEWMDATGSPVTRTFEIVNDGTTLTNAEVWAEVQYLGDGSFPVASSATSGIADVLATGGNITSSSATWTTTGLSSPVKQKIDVTFTPNMKGYFRIVFKVARASKTVYISPRPNEV